MRGLATTSGIPKILNKNLQRMTEWYFLRAGCLLWRSTCTIHSQSWKH